MPNFFNIINSSDVDGATPLHAAAKNRDKYLMSLLLENGADVHAVTKENKSVLFYLFESFEIFGNSKYECHEMLNLLLSKGVPTSIRDKHGRTILHIAAEKLLDESILTLLPYFKRSWDFVEIETSNTFFHKLVSRLYRSDDYKYEKLITAILKMYPDLIYIKNKLGKTPLQIAVERQLQHTTGTILKFYKEKESEVIVMNE